MDQLFVMENPQEGDFQYEDVSTGAGWQPVPYPPLRVLCVVGQGYGFYSGKHHATVAADSEHGEVIAFVIGIANSLLRPRTARYGLPFGYYLSVLSQTEALPPAGSPEESEAILHAVGEVGRDSMRTMLPAQFFDQRLKHRGPDTILGNIDEVGKAL